MHDDAKLEPEQRKPATGLPPSVEPVEATVEAKPFVIRAKDMGLKLGYNFDKVWELIEEIEGPDYK
jgi:hypothetical protein